jgi:hypothetical protein
MKGKGGFHLIGVVRFLNINYKRMYLYCSSPDKRVIHHGK